MMMKIKIKKRWMFKSLIEDILSDDGGGVTDLRHYPCIDTHPAISNPLLS
jgi:hypothetical protein